MGLARKFAELPPCTGPSVIVHCNQNEAGHQTIKAPSMPCRGAADPWKHSLAFMPEDWWNWQIKWMESVSVGSYQHKSEWGFFFIPDSNFTVCPYSFQNFRGKLLIWGNSPSVAFETALIQDVRDRTVVERLYWEYIYLKARNPSDIMHWYDRKLQLIS